MDRNKKGWKFLYTKTFKLLTNKRQFSKSNLTHTHIHHALHLDSFDFKFICKMLRECVRPIINNIVITVIRIEYLFDLLCAVLSCVCWNIIFFQKLSSPTLSIPIFQIILFLLNPKSFFRIASSLKISKYKGNGK